MKEYMQRNYSDRLSAGALSLFSFLSVILLIEIYSISKKIIRKDFTIWIILILIMNILQNLMSISF